jgi:hypothetical protein
MSGRDGDSSIGVLVNLVNSTRQVVSAQTPPHVRGKEYHPGHLTYSLLWKDDGRE